MPLLLMTSPQDHVVEPEQSDFLADHYGGPVERVALERSYHVATQDYDKELIFERAVEFAIAGHRSCGGPMIASGMLASIPSPSSGSIEIGPLSIHAYGLMIALGVVAAVWLLGRRLEAIGAGTREDASAMAVWGVVAGIIGARLYHVATDWSSFEDDLGRIVRSGRAASASPAACSPASPSGCGRASGGASRRRSWPTAPHPPCRSPRPSAGGATGSTKSCSASRPTCRGRSRSATPTRCAAGLSGRARRSTRRSSTNRCGTWRCARCCIAIDRRWKLRPPRLMFMYLLGYGVGRFWVEGLRIDPADHVAGLRWNQWVALVVAVGSALYLVISARRAVEPATAAEHESETDEPSEYVAADEQLND